MPNHWTRLPITLRAIVAAVLTAAISANVWLLLLLNRPVQLAAGLEVLFLTFFLWWAHGGGPPRAARAFRRQAFRSSQLTAAQWTWGLIAALFFATTVHAAIVLLFRVVPYPVAAFRHGYNLSFIPSQPLRWVAVIVSAASAAICEETGFRGFLQQPIEDRHGVSAAVFLSSFFFLALHLTKAWASLGMLPIVFGAGLLLGLLAWSAGSLIPSIIGHFVMDVGLFAYWTGIAGTFKQRPITETGVDLPFFIALGVCVISLFLTLFSIARLRKAVPSDTRMRFPNCPLGRSPG
jgi:membrane protease YdiL (CAAX protease family)